MLTPLDIRNKVFPKSFRGYNEEDVDEFLDQVVKEFEILFKENAELKEALAAKESNIGQYRDLEETIKQTLLIAQQTAEDVRSGAKKEAAFILEEARLQAEKIIAGAEERAKQFLAEYEGIQKESHLFRSKLRSLLLTHLELLGENEVKADDVLAGPGG